MAVKRISRQAIDFLRRELDDHHWQPYVMRSRFGRTDITFSDPENADGIMQWDEMMNPFHALDFKLERKSPVSIRLVPFVSGESQKYYTAIDNSFIRLSGDAYREMNLRLSSRQGFRKIRQRRNMSVFVFDSRDSLFEAMGSLRLDIAFITGSSLKDICMTAWKRSIAFRYFVPDTRGESAEDIEELKQVKGGV
jgi:hypothetical protein